MAQEASLRVAARVACTEAEGPFARFALWVQGCSLRCPGCCNPEYFAAEGAASAVAALAAELRAARDAHALEGLSVLGGEPAEQAAGVAALCREARALGLGVIVFSGYTLAELRRRAGGEELLAAVDTLIDGRFEAGRREPAGGRRWIGSTNQRVVHLTPRYADPALWHGSDHAELQIGPEGQVSLHGAPELVRRLARALAQPR